MEKIYETIDSVESLEKALKRLRKAQNEFSHYTQEQVDKIFAAAAIATKPEYLLPKWRLRKRAWEWLKIK